MTDDEVFENPDQPVPGMVWWQGTCTCSICGHQGVSVVPIEAGLVATVVNLECPECHNLTFRPED